MAPGQLPVLQGFGGGHLASSSRGDDTPGLVLRGPHGDCAQLLPADNFPSAAFSLPRPNPQTLSQGFPAQEDMFVLWSHLARPQGPPWPAGLPVRPHRAQAFPRPSLQALHGPSPQRCTPTPQTSGLGLGSPLSRPALLALVTFRPCGCHHNSVPNVTNDSVLPRFLSLVSCKRTQNSHCSLC